MSTALSLIISAMAAYGFSKVIFKGRDMLFLVVLATFMIPTQAILVPQFIMYRWLGLFDSHIGHVLLAASGVLGTFLLRQFFLGIHDEIIESARIDAAGHWTIFSRIALPLVQPARYSSKLRSHGHCTSRNGSCRLGTGSRPPVC